MRRLAFATLCTALLPLGVAGPEADIDMALRLLLGNDVRVAFGPLFGPQGSKVADGEKDYWFSRSTALYDGHVLPGTTIPIPSPGSNTACSIHLITDMDDVVIWFRWADVRGGCQWYVQRLLDPQRESFPVR